METLHVIRRKWNSRASPLYGTRFWRCYHHLRWWQGSPMQTSSQMMEPTTLVDSNWRRYRYPTNLQGWSGWKVEILRRELVGFPWMSHNVWATYVYISIFIRVCVQNYIAVYWVQFTNWKEASGMIPLTSVWPKPEVTRSPRIRLERIFVPRVLGAYKLFLPLQARCFIFAHILSFLFFACSSTLNNRRPRVKGCQRFGCTFWQVHSSSTWDKQVGKVQSLYTRSWTIGSQTSAVCPTWYPWYPNCTFFVAEKMELWQQAKLQSWGLRWIRRCHVPGTCLLLLLVVQGHWPHFLHLTRSTVLILIFRSPFLSKEHLTQPAVKSNDPSYRFL